MHTLLPAILIILALVLTTSIALIISYRRHRYLPSSFFSSSWSKSNNDTLALPLPTTRSGGRPHDHFAHLLPKQPPGSPSPYQHQHPHPHPHPHHQTSTNTSTSLIPQMTEQYLVPPPGSSYSLPNPSRTAGHLKIAHHPSLKRKRALPAVAAHSAYALPVPILRLHKPSSSPGGEGGEKGRVEARSPTHSVADWGVHGDGGDGGGRVEKGGLAAKGNRNFEDIHLGIRKGVALAPDLVFTGGGPGSDKGHARAHAHARTASEGVWAEKARRVAERQMVEGQGVVEGEKGAEGLGAFDFEREESGRPEGKERGKESTGLKGWRVSLFGKSEFSG